MVAAPAPSLRVVFFGTPAFAVPTLDALAHSAHRVVAVISQPDRPHGRGQRVSDAPVKARARELGIPVLQPERLKEPAFLDALAQLKPDLGVVAAYGRLLPPAVLDLPRLGLINVHASLLPKYRGAAPVHRAVMAGEHETGVTIMRIVQALDAGAMLASRRRSIGPDDTSDEVERDLAVLGADLLVEVADRVAAGPIEEIPQDDRLTTYASRLSRQDSIIDWTRPAHAIHNQVRGLHPWPLASTFLGGRRVIIRRTAVVRGPAGAAPGTIVEAAGETLRVATGDGTILILDIQPEGKRPMHAREFLAGHTVHAGTAFQPPPDTGGA
ncbi:MAG TPA: methionyl-tRNA formyltransferase [Vicinamibacterales bacterium]|nr:methionyl-tRNA formyltransferase [Vicinamibacterales bacterium]